MLKSYKWLKAIAIFTLFSAATGCSKTDSSMSGTNTVCAFIESYQDTKTLIMKNSFDALESAKSIIPTPESLGSVSKLSEEDQKIILNYRNDMLNWTADYVEFLSSGDKIKFDKSNQILEKEINTLANTCESKGWRFKTNWR